MEYNSDAYEALKNRIRSISKVCVYFFSRVPQWPATEPRAPPPLPHVTKTDRHGKCTPTPSQFCYRIDPAPSAGAPRIALLCRHPAPRPRLRLVCPCPRPGLRLVFPLSQAETAACVSLSQAGTAACVSC
jgi:hypothetical protein